jgi:hypothetical protein
MADSTSNRSFAALYKYKRHEKTNSVGEQDR